MPDSQEACGYILTLGKEKVGAGEGVTLLRSAPFLTGPMFDRLSLEAPISHSFLCYLVVWFWTPLQPPLQRV